MKNNISLLLTSVYLVFGICLLAFCYVLFGNVVSGWFDFSSVPSKTAIQRTKTTPKSEQVVDGIHLETGLVYAEGFDIVRGTCTACHSAKLVTQNRASREGWKQMLTWMQATQGLWELGEQEPIILDYLATHYAPEAIGRRANIDMKEVEWYILNLEEE